MLAITELTAVSHHSRSWQVDDLTSRTRLKLTLTGPLAIPADDRVAAMAFISLASILSGYLPEGLESEVKEPIIGAQDADRFLQWTLTRSNGKPGFLCITVIGEDDAALDGEAPRWIIRDPYRHEVFHAAAALAGKLILTAYDE